MSHDNVWLKFSIRILCLVGCALAFSACPGSKSKSDELNAALHNPRLTQPFLSTAAAEKQKKLLTGLFVDGASKAINPDGKTWATAFPTIMAAINASKGQNIYVAAGTYKSPRINLRDKEHIRLHAGYKSGDLYERDAMSTADDAWVILDGQGNTNPLVSITGKANHIAFLGGFSFEHVTGGTAVIIEGDAKDKPVRDVLIVGARFKDNNAAPAIIGGGIRVKFAEGIRLDDIDASKNKAGPSGGFASLMEAKDVSINKGTWEGNEAGLGGALYVESVERMVMSGQILKGNKAREGGGIYLKKQNNQDLTDLTFDDNEAQNTGAGISIYESNSLSMSRVKFIKNKVVAAGGNGGALRFEGGDGFNLRLGDNVVTGNTAQSGGAFSIIDSSNVTIQGGKFTKNEAAQHGGTAFFHRIRALDIQNVDIDGSTALAGYGGAFMISEPGKRIFIKNISIKHGQAREMGGGIYFYDAYAAAPPTVTIENSRFEENKTKANGGAIGTNRISYAVTISQSIFKKNYSTNYGGALALDGKYANARFIFGKGTKFIENRSKENFGGGVILVVFDDTRAALPVPNGEDRQLVFYNALADVGQNSAGDGLGGQFMRVTNHDVDDTRGGTAPNQHAPPDVFLAEIAPPNPEKILRYFIAYGSPGGAGPTAPWDRFQFAWETNAGREVYVW